MMIWMTPRHLALYYIVSFSPVPTTQAGKCVDFSTD